MSRLTCGSGPAQKIERSNAWRAHSTATVPSIDRVCFSLSEQAMSGIFASPLTGRLFLDISHAYSVSLGEIS